MYIKTSSWRRKGRGQRKKEREHGRANIKWKNLLFLRLGLLFPFGEEGAGRKRDVKADGCYLGVLQFGGRKRWRRSRVLSRLLLPSFHSHC